MALVFRGGCIGSGEQPLFRGAGVLMRGRRKREQFNRTYELKKIQNMFVNSFFGPQIQIPCEKPL